MGLGIVGYVTPMMPGTVFVIISLYCFRRGSVRFENWLLNHKWFGETLRDWDRTKGIRPATKKRAVILLWLALGISMVIVFRKIWLVWMLFAIGLFVSWYILSRPDVEA